MADIIDAVDPSEGTPQKPQTPGVSDGTSPWYQAREHFFWFSSRAALLAGIAFSMIFLDIPLRSLVDGDALKQLQSEKQKTLLDEVQMLRESLRQVSELNVAMATIRSNYRATGRAERGEYERARERFVNAANRFEERFSARRSVLADSALERLMYDIRDASRRIVDHLNESLGAVDMRKLGTQADLMEQLTDSFRANVEAYICKRSERTISSDGKCA